MTARAEATAGPPTGIAATRNSPPTRRGRIPRRAGATQRLRARTLHRQAAATAAGAAIALHAVTVEAALRGVMEAAGAALTVEEAGRAAGIRAVEGAGIAAAVEEDRTAVVADIRTANPRF